MTRTLPIFGGGLVLVLALVLMALAASCSSAPANSRIGIDAPDESQFGPVQALLDHRCGSLDCHGSRQRNLIIYGCEGLRLDDAGLPGCRNSGGVDTTADEIDATYRSLVGLEPTVMSNVVNQGGQYPQLLTFVRKARGEEDHKGGALIVPGDSQDLCIAAWLQGVPDPDAYAATCTEALATP